MHNMKFIKTASDSQYWGSEWARSLATCSTHYRSFLRLSVSRQGNHLQCQQKSTSKIEQT